MGRRKGGARVLGPYPEDYGAGPVWRILQVDEAGTRTTHYARSEREAAKLVIACKIDLGIPTSAAFTVSQALDAWLKHKEVTKSWSKRTFERTATDVRFFAAAQPDAPVALVNDAWIRTYLERVAHLALASQQSRYHAVTEFLGFAVRRGYLKENPCDKLDPTELPWRGKRARRKLGRGKPQLRNVAEVEAYLAAAAKLTKPLDRVAAVLPLLTGMRSGELRHLQVADVDFRAGRIWVRAVEDDEDEIEEGWDVKTAASRRTVDLPETIQADLETLCKDKAPGAFVFASNRTGGAARERKWLNRLVKKVCEAGKTRVICAHGLRDTFTSLMSELGKRSAADIAALVGHADQGKTAKRHYIGAPGHQDGLRLVKGGRK